MNDDVFIALAAGYRRRLLVRLLADDTQYVTELSDASDEMAAANEDLLLRHLSSGRHVAGVDEDALRARHVHLPKLDDFGFVEWDRDASLVRRGPRYHELRPIIELLADERSRLTIPA